MLEYSQHLSISGYKIHCSPGERFPAPTLGRSQFSWPDTPAAGSAVAPTHSAEKILAGHTASGAQNGSPLPWTKEKSVSRSPSTLCAPAPSDPPLQNYFYSFPSTKFWLSDICSGGARTFILHPSPYLCRTLVWWFSTSCFPLDTSLVNQASGELWACGLLVWEHSAKKGEAWKQLIIHPRNRVPKDILALGKPGPPQQVC